MTCGVSLFLCSEYGGLEVNVLLPSASLVEVHVSNVPRNLFSPNLQFLGPSLLPSIPIIQTFPLHQQCSIGYGFGPVGRTLELGALTG